MGVNRGVRRVVYGVATRALALLLVVFGALACEVGTRDEGRATVREGAQEGVRGGSREGFGAAVGFRSRARLVEHFEKHGHEFGAISVDQYLRRAQALRDARVGGAGSGAREGVEGAERGDVVELVRADGVVSRFDRRSGAFLAFDRDGTIRTFFRPNDGEAYFRRQGRRRPTR